MAQYKTCINSMAQYKTCVNSMANALELATMHYAINIMVW